MKHLKYISANRIINKLQRNYPDLEWNDRDIIEWIGEALGLIDAAPMYEDAVAFIEVKNYQCGMPCGIHQIYQIAKNLSYDDSNVSQTATCPGEVILTQEEEQTPIPVPLDCRGRPITGVELAYYRPYFDLVYEHDAWMHTNVYHTNYAPVRLAEHQFFNSLVCAHDPAIYDSCQYEYTIVPKAGVLRFSFETGQIALSYSRQPVDEDGYPMIPDHESYESAMQSYCIYRKMSQRFYSNKEGSVAQLQKAEQDWQWYCGQAASVSMMMRGIDEMQNFLDMRQHVMPKQHRYFGFFGKLAHPEDRTFNDPNHFNSLRGYYY